MRPQKLYKMSDGTPVRIKESVQCAEIYHKGGRLVFQDKCDVEKGEYRCGILIEGFGVCYAFHPECYETIKHKGEPTEVEITLKQKEK